MRAAAFECGYGRGFVATERVLGDGRLIDPLRES